MAKSARKPSKKPLYTRGGIAVYAYDTVDFLDSDEMIAGYLSLSLTEEYDPDIFLLAIANALRAKGLNNIESLLKIAEEMRPPLDSPEESAVAVRNPAAKKVIVRKALSRSKQTAPRPSRRTRETVVA